MQIAVAATAPLGADVLERLAEEHDIAYLLTRPDRPRGRGRRVAAPPAKEAAERLGIEVRQPERLDDAFDPEVDTVIAAAYGLLIPEPVLERALWLNVHPSLLPRWRGAAPIERALMAGDSETGVSIIKLVPELDAGPIAAQRAFPLGEEDDFGTVSARAGELAAELLEEVLPQPQPELTPQPEEGLTYAAKIGPEDRELDWSRPPEELLNQVRALSPHIGARGELHGRPVTIWRARIEGDKLVPVEVQAEGRRRMSYDEFGARPVSASPARRAAFETVQRVFEQEAYADRAFPAAAAGLDPRERALAQRLAYGTIQRVRTLDHGIEALGRRPVRKLDPPVRDALRLGAYQLAFSEVAMHAAVNESVELVRDAGLERAVSFANAVLRRLALGLRELVEALPEATPEEAALKHSYPDWVAQTWWRELGPDEALALMRAQNEPPETVVRRNTLKQGEVEGEPDPEIPNALRVDQVDERALAEGLIWPQSRGSQLAGLCVDAREGERVLDLCAAPGGKATQLAERAAEVVAVEKHPGRARELEANCRRLGAANVRVVNADALELPGELRDLRPRTRGRALLGPRRARLPP